MIENKNIFGFFLVFDLDFVKPHFYLNVLQHSNYIFDASIFDICNSLFKGNKLVICDRNLFLKEEKQF
jgi:non-ribosomal peptide synthetase component F